jgi:hypothetical protein
MPARRQLELEQARGGSRAMASIRAAIGAPDAAASTAG